MRVKPLDFLDAAERGMLFKNYYGFTCPRCGYEDSVPPSLLMTDYARNLAYAHCEQCKMRLRLAINDTNDAMIAEVSER